jgi:adenylate cyclase
MGHSRPMDDRRWEEAGLYDPDDPGAPERHALLTYLADRGATVQQMVEAHRLGGLPGLAGELVRGSRGDALSVEEVAERCGISVERVERILLASGLPVAVDTELPEGLDRLITAFDNGAALMGEEGLLAFTRVLGAAAITIAEAAVALFYAQMGPGAEHEGADELGRARASEAAMLAFVQVPEVLSRVLMAQFDRASRRAALTRGWSASAEGHDEEGNGSPDGGPSEVIGFGFVDLVDSTGWAEGLNLRDHSLALSRFESVAWSVGVSAGGRIVKMIGDEVFFAAPSSDIACSIAAEVCRAVGEDPVLPPARGAVGYGKVTPREGDYFGPLVNLVARLTKAARPGAVVATGEAAAGLTADRWDVTELGTLEVRGVDGPVRALEVTPRTRPASRLDTGDRPVRKTG